MSRISTFRITVAAITLLLVLAAVGSTIGSAYNPGPTTPSIDRASVVDGTATIENVRKLPPPEGSVKEVPADPNKQPQACVEPVVNVSQRTGNESESFVVINPTNPDNIVAFSNLASASSIFRGYSTDGGATWTRGTVATGVACCDGQAAFDMFGNLFMVYLNSGASQVNVILSTDGGATFSAPVNAGVGSVDQPSIAVGNGSVWVDWNASGSMMARGAPVTGLGTWGPFNTTQVIPTGTGSFGGIAVGPGPNGGKVMLTYMTPTGGQGPATIYVNTDVDGLGPGGFGPRILATTTNVGGFDFIPAQARRSVDAEAGLVWDSTGGPFNDRVYLVYTEETVNENNDTEIYVRTSTDDGTTWSAPVRVNDDLLGLIRSQFNPYITLDRTSGVVAVGFHDARNDNGVPGVGGTNTIPNDDAEYFASYSTDGGLTWAANDRLSGGFSNSAASNNGIDYGDYTGQDAYGGKFVAVWADNSNCDGTNPNGTLSALDLYMGVMPLPGGGTPTPTVTGTPPTATNTRTATSTAIVTPTTTRTSTATPNPCLITYAFTTATATIVPGTVNTGSACDDCVVDVTLPFPFRLYDQTFTAVGLDSNGKAHFPTGASVFTNTCLPGAGMTYTIFPYWDDQRTDAAGMGIFTSVSGTAPNRIFNIEWRTTYFSGGGTANYTLRLYEGLPGGNSRFDVIYGTVTQGNTSATSGVQKNDTLITQYFCNGSGGDASNNRLVSYSAPTGCSTPGATGTATQTATTPPTSTHTSTPVPPTNTATQTATNTATNTITVPTDTPTLTPMPPCTIQFIDVPPGHTFYDSVRCLACRGIVSGYSDGTFRPNNPVTRGQLAKMVSNAAGFTEDPNPQIFADVPPSNTFYEWINRLTRRGHMTGYTCGGPGEPCINNMPYFRPFANATRGQTSKIVSNAAGFTEMHTGQTFQDVPPTHTFYQEIERLASRNVMGGYPCGGPGEPCIAPQNRPYFRPGNDVTRGQSAKIVANTFYPGCVTP